jgi:hypothetical protein
VARRPDGPAYASDGPRREKRRGECITPAPDAAVYVRAVSAGDSEGGPVQRTWTQLHALAVGVTFVANASHPLFCPLHVPPTETQHCACEGRPGPGDAREAVSTASEYAEVLRRVRCG